MKSMAGLIILIGSWMDISVILHAEFDFSIGKHLATTLLQFVDIYTKNQ